MSLSELIYYANHPEEKGVDHMSENEESVLVQRASELLGKETKHMKMIDVIAELVEIAEKQAKMMNLFLLEDK
jgi:hypothetical protein